jgi:mono/diheme cytochrome c family protein
MNSIHPAHKILLLIALTLVVGATVVTLGLYDVIKIEWVSFMEIQPSYRPMEEPLPVAARSIPVEGAVNIPGVAATNPIPADNISVERGSLLYSVTCVQCHGPEANGNGIVGLALVNRPADLTGTVVQGKLDSDLFNTISNGIIVNGQIRMPALNENLTVRDRWDLVNFIRSVKAAADQATPTPQP